MSLPLNGDTDIPRHSHIEPTGLIAPQRPNKQPGCRQVLAPACPLPPGHGGSLSNQSQVAAMMDPSRWVSDMSTENPQLGSRRRDRLTWAHL